LSGLLTTDKPRLERAPRLVVERSCCACRTRRSKKELIRLTRTPRGEVALDSAGTMPGRGSYVCLSAGCIDIALGRGRLARCLRAKLTPHQAAVLREELLGYLGVANGWNESS
jgi:uncharacterized protein